MYFRICYASLISILVPAGVGARRLLRSGTEESLVNIPWCIAAQLLGEEIAILSEGMLSLVVVPKSEKEEEPVLTLTVGKSAFPLYKNTVFGTLANDSRTYVFKLVSEGASQG